jgi:hypothetical protein
VQEIVKVSKAIHTEYIYAIKGTHTDCFRQFSKADLVLCY